MPQAYFRLFYHFVWATWDRLPLLEGPIEGHAYALIRQQCEKMGCDLRAINGMPDHVHLLVTIPRTLCIADFIEAVKGCSSRALNEAHASEDWAFKWQGGYGVLTVSPTDVRKVAAYIRNQKQHHANGTVWAGAEKTWEDTPTKAAEPPPQSAPPRDPDGVPAQAGTVPHRSPTVQGGGAS